MTSSRNRRPSSSARERDRASTSTFRIRMLVLMVAVMFSLVGARALQIQVVDSEAQAASAAGRMTVARNVPAQRGSITGRDGQVMAFTEATVNVVADPAMIASNGKEPETMTRADHEKAGRAPAEMAAIIASHLGVDVAEVEGKLRQTSSRYQLIAKQVPATAWVDLNNDLNRVVRDDKGKVVRGGYVGVFREANPRRVYPMGTVGSNIIGSMSEGKGLLGLEFSQESSLAGTPGRETYETSPNGRIPLGNQVLTPAKDGRDHQLTLDPDLQWMVERRLAQRVDEAGGQWGVAVVMDIETGELLTLANYPSYDANEPGKGKAEDLGNRAIGSQYEPGSVQKVLTLASLLDAGVTTPDRTYRIGQKVKVGSHEISDPFTHDEIDITTRGILVKSSNVGAVTAARELQPSRLRDYMAGFGLGQRTNLGLPGEASGSLPPADMPQYQADSMAFGYGVSMTSVQMAAAIAAVANGGVYTEPTLVRATGSGGVMEPAPAPTTRRVVSEEASRQTLEMMEQRTLADADRIGTPGYRSGAKTGSARLAKADGGYSGQVASIVGVAPIEDPQVLVYVLVARPDTEGAGLGMAGPVYRDIMALALPRYGVQPSREMVTQKLPLVKE